MTDLVAGSFTGLQARVYFSGSADYLVTTGGYDLQNVFDNPWPSGDALDHNVFCGRKLNSLNVERQMADSGMIQQALNATPTTGTVQTIVTAGATLNTAGNITQAGTNAGNGLVALTTAGGTTTNATPAYITIFGTDINGNIIQDVLTMPALSLAATVLTSVKAFATVTSIDNQTALGAGVTCGVASLAGVTTTGVTSAPATFTVKMSLINPTTGKQVVMTFANCMIKSDPVTWKSGKTVTNKIEFVMQNPNTDISAQFA